MTAEARTATVIPATVATLLIAYSLYLTPVTRAQTEVDCDTLIEDGSYWRGCRFTPTGTNERYCIGCSVYPPVIRPGRRLHSADLSDQDVLLFLAYGLSDGLSEEIHTSLWQHQSLTRARRIVEPEHLFTLRWHSSRFEERRRRTDLSSFLTTVLSSELLRESAPCHRCEFTLAMGLVWGYRWSTVSGRVAAQGDIDHLALTPNYGFRFMHRASPKWRYVLEVARDSKTLDLVGKAQWRIRPDAYLSVTSGRQELGSLAAQRSDLSLDFSFQ